MTRVLVVGSAGQDGCLLFDRLTAEGHEVLGIERGGLRGARPDGIAAADLLSRRHVLSVVGAFRPDAIFYLAAFHGSSEQAPEVDLPDAYERSHAIHVTGLLHVLDAARATAPRCRTFYAASSRVWGEPLSDVQDELTPMSPRCVYGATKASGVLLCRLFRNAMGAHASVGFLYNHESPLRRSTFVSRRIVDGARAILRGERERLVIGDLSARADWGYAPDFVDAMIRIAALDQPDEFVVATGESRSVGDFVLAVFALAGLDPARHVEEDPGLLPPARRPGLVGNASKLRRATGWAPTVSFEEMVAILWKSACAEGAPH